MGLSKYQMWTDDTGITPGIAALIILVAGSIISVGAVAYFSQPNITYNVSDTGFSFAGIGSDTITLIVAVIVVLALIWLLMRRPKKNGS